MQALGSTALALAILRYRFKQRKRWSGVMAAEKFHFLIVGVPLSPLHNCISIGQELARCLCQTGLG